jgi:hypothetical protein
VAHAFPKRNSGVIRQDMPDGSTLLFDRVGRVAYPVTATAALVWEACDGTNTAEEMVRRLVHRYDAPETQVRDDVEKLLAQLTELNLLEQSPDA